ncbi:hypothetical protein IFM61606_08574 [Aspergillus udagawae]|nr:hypothetical protein IFM61606_08574 [Aspergillus udagawae]GFF36345.1 hypothetical protein IFM51744_03095 [Aspergillus udagawae]GFG17926.1 hypothetical protein IFM5058_08739 [Aspergillus udagawae]
MQLLKSVTALGLFLTAAVEAAPVAAPADRSMNEASPSVLFIKKRDRINDCGDSTFINQSSGGSPRVDDCLQIARNIAGGGTWTFEGFGVQHQLLQYGTCAFGVTQGSRVTVKIGNQDIIDLINDSISRFQWYGLVGSKGTMNCQVSGYIGQESVSWGIYHT